jgi:tetratricopeptide (TPR) repeat protein
MLLFFNPQNQAMQKIILIFSVMTLLTACSYFAIESAPKKQEIANRSQTSLNADAVFWETLHNGEYDKISTALEKMKAAYLETPNDSLTAAHVGWLHIWRVAERSRLKNIPTSITDDITMARKYFQEAVNLNPADARFLGFMGDLMVMEGQIHHDERLMREGYYVLKDSVNRWPEFNLFTAGYIMSPLDTHSDLFQEGLEMQWQNVDVCFNEKTDRKNPDYAKYMSLSTTTGTKRVCWNSWIAPHNFEGFLLNMGDMLVKSGDWQTAQKIYQNAKLSPDYSRWKFRKILENRIKNAKNNVSSFNKESNSSKDEDNIMINTSFSCMGCHQQ